MSEADIQARIMLDIGALPGVRVFRNNVGAAMDRTGRLVRYGVGGNGGSDLLGWRSLVVTPADVGRALAIFTAIEVKDERGRLRPGQAAFLDAVRAAGGIAGIARSPDDARRLVLP